MRRRGDGLGLALEPGNVLQAPRPSGFDAGPAGRSSTPNTPSLAAAVLILAKKGFPLGRKSDSSWVWRFSKG
jgi:hypothetical protein